MTRYFKLLCVADPAWILDEFSQGRARFGWSPPGTDLREIRKKEWTTRSDDEKITWTYTKFLVERIRPGDRVVVQPEQPISRFLIGEVIAPGYDFSPGTLDDFNHLLHVRPLTPEPIPVNSKAVTGALKHDLSKRGQYYQIYPENSIKELDALAQKAATRIIDLTAIRTDEDTHDHTARAARASIVKEIARLWPAKDFERFCESLCEKLDYVEVNERKDSGEGWDLRIRIINPITQTILLDDVPVQCKNHTGPVTTTQPIDDLERCIRNAGSDVTVALLFILGDLTDEFRRQLQQRQEWLSTVLHRRITFELVEQDRIADLYARYIGETVQKTSSAV